MPSPSASQAVDGSTPVVTGPVCGKAVVPLESVLATFGPLWRLRLPSGAALATPPVAPGCAVWGGTVTVSAGAGVLSLAGGVAAGVSTGGVAGGIAAGS